MKKLTIVLFTLLNVLSMAAAMIAAPIVASAQDAGWPRQKAGKAGKIIY